VRGWAALLSVSLLTASRPVAAGSAIVAHASHDDGDSLIAKLLRHAAKEHVHRRAMALHRGFIREHCDISQR